MSCSLILLVSKRAIAVVRAKLMAVVATISHLTQSFAYERFTSSMVSDDGIVLLPVLCSLDTGLTHFPFVFIFILFSDAGAEETAITAYWLAHRWD